ncbi:MULTISPECIES: nitronate monooxygenase [unclassified Faecalibacterium]|uniref:nitronate monooxygenase n=1 Tax=unclassified Faecalibacterium TaxID=2646395 RepID=UPI000B3698C9|nr:MULTISPECIES: nitronate monooxygenase [unclassified Faecalibacterium]OUN36615.1 nitronate monooxygenase [Faecalibacterium sp. An77]OUP26291.1 nitronate monooxygenase [Faecalibacterium sp. An192]OUQ35826.1 nitronate monooxygenase [Faecalibacterium sp. An122]
MKINELLGTEFPIIQGGMANIATGAFAAAVSNAGALGLIGSGGMDAETLRKEIRTARAATDKPFGVNLMLMNPHIDELAKVVVEEGVQVVTTGAGNPGKYVPAWKEAGIKVFPVVAAPILAKRLERYEVDGFIAEGTESGGHVGEMTTMALVPQVVDAVSAPVIAAGGIADGRQMAAAFALGACGVQVGTCLLVSQECPIHENYKLALIKAGANDTVVTGRSTGAPVRVLKNKMARQYLEMEKENMPLAEREKLTLGSLRRAVFDGDLDTGSFMSGQVAGMLTEIKPLRQIFEEMMAGCEATMKGLQA